MTQCAHFRSESRTMNLQDIKDNPADQSADETRDTLPYPRVVCNIKMK